MSLELQHNNFYKAEQVQKTNKKMGVDPMVSDMMKKVGSWSFIIGLIIAIIMGFVGTGNMTLWVLAVLGLIVGLINVSHGESHLYLVASIAFLVSASSLTVILSALRPFLENIAVFVGPGAAVVAIRALYDMAREH